MFQDRPISSDGPPNRENAKSLGAASGDSFCTESFGERRPPDPEKNVFDAVVVEEVRGCAIRLIEWLRFPKEQEERLLQNLPLVKESTSETSYYARSNNTIYIHPDHIDAADTYYEETAHYIREQLAPGDRYELEYNAGEMSSSLILRLFPSFLGWRLYPFRWIERTTLEANLRIGVTQEFFAELGLEIAHTHLHMDALVAEYQRKARKASGGAEDKEISPINWPYRFKNTLTNGINERRACLFNIREDFSRCVGVIELSGENRIGISIAEWEKVCDKIERGLTRYEQGGSIDRVSKSVISFCRKHETYLQYSMGNDAHKRFAMVDIEIERNLAHSIICLDTVLRFGTTVEKRPELLRSFFFDLKANLEDFSNHVATVHKDCRRNIEEYRTHGIGYFAGAQYFDSFSELDDDLVREKLRKVFCAPTAEVYALVHALIAENEDVREFIAVSEAPPQPSKLRKALVEAHSALAKQKAESRLIEELWRRLGEA